MPAMDPVDRVRMAHACEDYAGQWAANPATSGSPSSVSRYVAEGCLSALCDRYTLAVVWAAVREHLDAHPEILAAGPLTDGQRAERQEARAAASRACLAEAEVPFREGRWAGALARVDRAELASPGLVDFARYRQIIAEHREA
ncbi:hypothetical protein AB0K35_27815 [Micromonospora sp. NPDC053740]|uniref:hypothetical protein n=1 Tax=Micromonospora sp. NPDC053740 TaxID=3155173 RepID=UPI0034444F4E